MGDEAREHPSATAKEELRAYDDVAGTSPDLGRAAPTKPGATELPPAATSLPVDVGALIGEALNDLMVGFGFAPAQLGSDDDGSVTAIFCASNNELLGRYPGLPIEIYPDSHACTDFTVVTSAGHDDLRVIESRLEGEELATVIEALGRNDLYLTASSVGRLPLEEAVSEIAALVSEVFRSAATTPRP